MQLFSLLWSQIIHFRGYYLHLLPACWIGHITSPMYFIFLWVSRWGIDFYNGPILWLPFLWSTVPHPIFIIYSAFIVAWRCLCWYDPSHPPYSLTKSCIVQKIPATIRVETLGPCDPYMEASQGPSFLSCRVWKNPLTTRFFPMCQPWLVFWSSPPPWSV